MLPAIDPVLIALMVGVGFLGVVAHASLKTVRSDTLTWGDCLLYVGAQLGLVVATLLVYGLVAYIW